MTMKLLSGAAALETAIASIERRGKKLDHDINVAAVSAMAHRAEHGDVTFVNRLIAAMPKGSRVNALLAFFEHFGAVKWDADEKKMKCVKGAQANIEAAMQTSWVAFKPEAEYVPIEDPARLFHALKAKMERDIKELGDKSKVTPAMIDALAQLERANAPLN